MEIGEILIQIGEILIIVALAYFSKHYHSKYSQLVKFFKHLYESLEDGTLTEEELKQLVEDAKDLFEGA